jgi:hypothetical protein
MSRVTLTVNGSVVTAEVERARILRTFCARTDC